jgi:hypothetical protein
MLLAAVLLAFAAAVPSTAQSIIDGFEDVDASAFTLDVASSASRYAGRYHFGESEGESDLVITVTKSGVKGELRYSDWDRKGKKWKSKKLTFAGTIVGNMLIAGPWNGIFVRKGDQHGLILFGAPTDLVRRNYGYRYDQ